MRANDTRNRKRFPRGPLFGLALLLLLAAGSGQAARADGLTVAGNTSGSFTTATGTNTGNTLMGLTYYSAQFSTTTSGGSASLNGAPYSPTAVNPQPNFNNLGSFNLDLPPVGTNDIYTGAHFTLQVTFTAPTDITGRQQATFTATLTGAVVRTVTASSYSINVDFDNTPQTFTFTRADGTTGTFTLAVNDVNGITPNFARAITGTITSQEQDPTPTPEPATVMLLGTGLAGAAAGARRRRRRAD